MFQHFDTPSFSFLFFFAGGGGIAATKCVIIRPTATRELQSGNEVVCEGMSEERLGC